VRTYGVVQTEGARREQRNQRSCLRDQEHDQPAKSRVTPRPGGVEGDFRCRGPSVARRRLIRCSKPGLARKPMRGSCGSLLQLRSGDRDQPDVGTRSPRGSGACILIRMSWHDRAEARIGWRCEERPERVVPPRVRDAAVQEVAQARHDPAGRNVTGTAVRPSGFQTGRGSLDMKRPTRSRVEHGQDEQGLEHDAKWYQIPSRRSPRSCR